MTPSQTALPATANASPAASSPAAPSPSPARPLHPFFHAGKFLLGDLISTLVFVGIYAVFHSIYLATALGIAMGAGQIAYARLRKLPIDAMQWLSLFLVVVFGSATLFTHDPRFIMIKPTLIYTAVAIVMCRPGWMKRYVPPVAQGRADDVMMVFGYVWAALMFFTGAANLLLGWYASPHVWAEFIAIFPLGSKIALFLIQYATMRFVVRTRMRAALAVG